VAGNTTSSSGSEAKGKRPKIATFEEFNAKLDDLAEKMERGDLEPEYAIYIMQNMKLRWRVAETLAKHGVSTGMVPLRNRAA
jgi:exonuclease VII small subunit